MPYSLKDAPVRDVLPPAALRLWVRTFNAVLEEGGNETAARQAAWGNVKKSGYVKGADHKWHKAEAVVASVYVERELLEPDDHGFEMRDPTPSKAFAVFRLLSFYPVINQRHDAFDEADVGESAVASLIGSPIFGNETLTDHFNREGTRGPQVGAVVDAKRHEDGVYALAALYKDVLQERYAMAAEDLATDLPTGFSVSMEVKFDPDEVRYLVDGRVLTRPEAMASGVAAQTAIDDNPRRYDARFLVPVEYHAVALLRRGRNADPTADILHAAASKEQPMPETEQLAEWHESDYAQAVGADLSSKERGKLPRSSFAHVDSEGKGHLPIHDEAHARNALARLNQTDIPADAKRSAFRKIIAAMRRFGVAPDKNSDAYKAYASYRTPEDWERMSKMMRDRPNRKTKKTKKANHDAMAATDPHLITLEGLSVLFAEDGALYRAELDIDDADEFVLGEVSELGPIIPEAGGSSMDEQQIKEALEKAREEAAAAKAAELEGALKSREQEIAKAAVEAFKGSEELKTLIADAKAEALAEYERARETIASRMKELETIQTFKDDDDRQAVETRVAETVGNDLEWFRLKAERYESALASVTKKASPKPAAVPTLTAAKGSAPKRNIFDFTDEE